MNKDTGSREPMNPYLAGLMLGLVLLGSYLVLGAGLGASGGLARIGAFLELRLAPEYVLQSPGFGAWGPQPLLYYLVFMLAGLFLGGLLSALLARRFRPMLERGGACTRLRRLAYTAGGGLLIGFADRLAHGCITGQALSGSALLLTGSLLFLVCVFAGGYATARFVGRQWHD